MRQSLHKYLSLMKKNAVQQNLTHSDFSEPVLLQHSDPINTHTWYHLQRACYCSLRRLHEQEENIQLNNFISYLYGCYFSFQIGMWRSSNLNSTTFKLRTFSPDSKFKECFKHFVVECEFVEKSLFYDWFHMHRQPESTDKPVFFSNSTCHINYSNIWMSNIVFAQWCVTRC